MHFPTRSISLALLLLLLFLVAAFSLQWWLARETRQLQRIALEDQRAKLSRVIAISGLPPERWDAAFQQELGAMVGGSVQLFRNGAPPADTLAAPGALSFTMGLPQAPGWQARVTFATPALIRTQVLHQRILATMALLALLLATVPLLAALLEARRGSAADGATRNPWAAVRAQAEGYADLARISNERTAALAAEHAARSRAEQDLQVHRDLLGQSLAERVRLGRELHDNICQTLYAVCLTLESVQKKSSLTPEMAARTGQCIAELRRLNQEVRTYLQDLEPGRVQSQSFSAALAGLLGTLPPEEAARIERRLDPEALELIPSQHVAEVINILREALSNSIRHGRPNHIILRAGRSDNAVALSVQDDGAGFSATGPRGHGLDNMQARAKALGGELQIDSTPGQGTRVILNLPLQATA